MLGSAWLPLPYHLAAQVAGDDALRRQDDTVFTERRGDIADFYEECRKGEGSLGYDRVLDRQRTESKLRELERDLLPDEPEADEVEGYFQDNEDEGFEDACEAFGEDEESEEASASKPEGFADKLFDFLEKNPRIGIALLISLIGMFMSLLEGC